MVEAETTAPLTPRGILDSRLGALETGSGPVTIRVAQPVTQLNLRIEGESASLAAVRDVLGADLPGALTSVTTAEGRLIIWLGPDEWLVVDQGRTTALEPTLRAAIGAAGAVVDQSGQRVSLMLEGDVQGLLAKGTALDLHPRSFPEGTAAQVMLGQAVVILVSQSSDSSRAQLIARSSFAPYVADWLVDALIDPLAYPASTGG